MIGFVKDMEPLLDRGQKDRIRVDEREPLFLPLSRFNYASTQITLPGYCHVTQLLSHDLSLFLLLSHDCHRLVSLPVIVT